MFYPNAFHDDWLKAGFGRDLSAAPTSGLPFFWDYRTDFTRPIQSPFEEAVLAVQKIAQERPGPYTVLLSGGVDSQAVLLAFQAAGVPFQVITFLYDGGRNHYDIETAIRLCSRQSIPINFHDVDLTEFHQSGEMAILASRYNTDSPHMICQLHGLLTCEQSGTFIMAGNPVLPRGSGKNTVYRGVTPWRLTAPCQMPNVVGLFHSYTRELHYSWQAMSIDDLFDGAPRIPDSDPVASYAVKIELYRRGGFDIIPQDKKTHGFEWLKTDIENTNPDFWKDGIHEYDRQHRIPLEEMIRINHSAKAIWNPTVFGPDK
jgi:hypothetical protein